MPLSALKIFCSFASLGLILSGQAVADQRFERTLDFFQIDAFMPNDDVANRTSVAGFDFRMSLDEMDDHAKTEGFQYVGQNSSEPELEYFGEHQGRQIKLEFNNFFNNSTLFRRTDDFYQDNVYVYALPGESGQIYAIRRTATSQSGSYGVNALWAAVEKRVGAKVQISTDHNGIQSATAVFSVTGALDVSGKCVDKFSNGMGARGIPLGLVGFGIADRHINLMRDFVSDECAVFFSVVVVPDRNGQVFKMEFRSVNGVALLETMEANNNVAESAMDDLKKEVDTWVKESKSTAPEL